MTIRAKPTADVAIDPSVVRALLQEQHADLAHLSLIEVGEGWDNKTVSFGRGPCGTRASSRGFGSPHRA